MGSYHDSHVVELVGKIIIVSIVVVFLVVIFVFFLNLYAKWFWYRREQDTNTIPRRRRGDFTAGYQEQQSGVTVLRRGLNPSFLKTIPVIPFNPNDFKQELECTICLSEVCEGEKTRFLPKCNHGFHVECIDMWFYSHSTCPICRNSVSDKIEISVENLLETQEQLAEIGDFPTNILFWGDETEVSTLTSQLEEVTSSSSSQRPDLVIHIPTQTDDDYDDDDDDNDNEKSPVSSRMRSLRRILSGSRMFINPF